MNAQGRLRAREFWDAHLEDNALRTGRKDTSAGAFLSTMVEAGGDILREMAKVDCDPAYMTEKATRIARSLQARDWGDALSPGELERLAAVKAGLAELPASTPETMAVKEMLMAITNREASSIKERLATVEGFIATSPCARREGEGLKKECSKIAEGLLALDNGLAFGVCALDHKDQVKGWQAAQSAATQAQDLVETKVLTPEEAEPFLQAAQSGSSEDLMMVLSGLHERAEGFLLEKVIACECGDLREALAEEYGHRGQAPLTPEERECLTQRFRQAARECAKV